MFQRYLKFDQVIYINKGSYTISPNSYFKIYIYIHLKVGCQLLSRVRNYDNKYKHCLFWYQQDYLCILNYALVTPSCHCSQCAPPHPSPHPPFLLEGLNLQPNFQKDDGGGGGLDRTSTFRELFSGGGGVQFLQKKKNLKYLMAKKSLQAKIIFSVITKNLNQEILTKNLITFER